MNGTAGTARRGLSAPRRNRYFHGKMMDVHHFELETAYGIGMRRLLNRLVTGSGVVCGLDVERGDDPCSVEITPGVAIDYWGREIVVPSRTSALEIPPELIERVCRSAEDEDADDDCGCDSDEDDRDRERRQSKGHGREEGEDCGPKDPPPKCPPTAWIHLSLCYHECETDPVAVLAGDCSTTTPCAPGSIREQYRVVFDVGKAKPSSGGCGFPDVLCRGGLDHAALATWVTRECEPPRRNPCLPLANIRLDCRADGCCIDEIDITIRPVVFGNGLLADILAAVAEEDRAGGYRRR